MTFDGCREARINNLYKKSFTVGVLASGFSLMISVKNPSYTIFREVDKILGSVFLIPEHYIPICVFILQVFSLCILRFFCNYLFFVHRYVSGDMTSSVQPSSDQTVEVRSSPASGTVVMNWN